MTTSKLAEIKALANPVQLNYNNYITLIECLETACNKLKELGDEAHTDHCEIMTYRRPCSCHVKECVDTLEEIESKLGGMS